MYRIVIGVTGASGQIYARKIITKLCQKGDIDLDIVFTDTALQVYQDEVGEEPGKITEEEWCTSSDSEVLHDGAENQPTRGAAQINLLDNHGYYNRNASGSNAADAMIIVPCTMGTVGRIASGATTDLLSRIAEVQLKERRRLVIVPRETPYSLIHLRNLTTLTEAGAIIAPASPSFYSNPSTLNELTDQFADRIIAIAGIADLNPLNKWML